MEQQPLFQKWQRKLRSGSQQSEVSTFTTMWEKDIEWSVTLFMMYVCVFTEDSVAFWHALKQAGLLEEVVEDFQKELQEVLKGLQERVCDPPLHVKG